MDIDAKLRPLYLLQILQERTDEDNYLTTAQLASILKQRYGMEPHRPPSKATSRCCSKPGSASMSGALPRTSIATWSVNSRSPS